jgi:hypothetical protein
MSDKEQEIHVGDFYESCNFHPCLCIERDDEWDGLMGISLVDGKTYSCSINSCGAWKMTPVEAMTSRLKGPQFGPEEIEAWGDPQTDWEEERKWWRHEGKDIWGFWAAPREQSDAG